MADRPKRPRRPRHRRNPDQLDAEHIFISGRPHRCTECGVSTAWGPSWRWYGSHHQAEKGELVLKFCDQHCQESYEAVHGKLKEDLDPGETVPKVHRARLTPSAFQVECPCCAHALDVAMWGMDAAGAYAAEDTPTECCTVMTCEHCGTVVEPVAVVVKEAYPHG